MERDKLGSRLGFLLLSAGCAIGIGNVWKFPYMVGQNGGGIFVLIYFIFLIALGVPIMAMEFAMGRASRKSPVKLYQQLEKQGDKWHIHGFFAFLGNIILMMFYTSVTGWILQYFVKMAKGDFATLNASGVSAEFSNMLSNPLTQIIFVALVCILGGIVCSFNIQKSLEKITKFMMIALLGIMVVLVINGLFLDGAKEGLKFYLVPSVSKIKEVGLFNVITGAMSQAFFTLSIGLGSMAIFGSYIDKSRSLLGEAVNVAVLDTFVAITAGLIIFPACFTYNNGVVNSGPPLIFETLPIIFNNMPLGRLWGSLFFVFLAFAAFSTIFAVFENIIACIMDLTNLSRRKSAVICAIGVFILSIPCILGFNVWSGFQPFGSGSSILDLEDFIVSNLFLPIGSLIFVIFCTWKKGWGIDNFVNEANEGKGLKITKWMKVYMKYVLPIVLLVFIIISLVTFFVK